jgi:ABC-type multidrug transport system fused ATPase/permease subunit
VKRLRGWKNLGAYRWHLSLLVALAAAEVALRTLLPWPMKILVDHAVGPVPPPPWLIAIAGDTRERWLIFAVLAGLAGQALHQAVLMTHTRQNARTGQLLTRDLRQRLFHHLQGLTLRHHSQLPVGEVAYRLQSDATFLERLVVGGVLPLGFSVLTLVVMFAILASIDRILALVSLAIVPILFLWIRWSAGRIRSRAEQTQALESRLSVRLHESFSAIRLVKSFAREPYERRRFDGAVAEAVEARLTLTKREAWFSLGVGNLIAAGTALVLLVGGLAIIRGRITIGTLLLAIAYLGFVYGPLAGIAGTIATIQHALASSRRVRDAFALATEVEDGSGPFVPLRGEIRFEQVTFAYEGTPVLRGVSFAVRPGEMVALVGPSGSGKTTLVSLIPRFFDPQSGAILIDGRDSRSYRLSALRQQIAIVQQEVIVLAGSIRANLRYGRLDASDAEIEAAAHQARAHEFIMRQRDGYETELAEAGGGLSGGEKQRLSIARAFLKNAPILILDEPTAALDTVSEHLVFSAVEQLRHDRTTLVIAHRLSTVRAADRILVLDAGQVVAEGSHAELLETSPLYRQLAVQLTEPAQRASGE